MKRKLRDITAAVLGFCLVMFGYLNRAKKEIRKNNYVTALYFHNPGKKLFEKLVKWLNKNGFTIISTNELAAILQGKIKAPQNAVWITFDDGWLDNMKNVVPFAAENKIPVTFFISTGPAEFSGIFWWRLAEKFRHLLPEPFKGEIERLWKIPESERMKIINELMEKSGGMEREAMTVNDIKSIAGYDFFTIGSHTVNHVITPNCSEDELELEFAESKAKLEQWTGKKINFFCYPNGDLSGREAAVLKKHGYEFAAAAGDKFINRDTDPFVIYRFSMGEGYFYEEVCHMLGVWQKVMNKFKP